MVAFQVIRVFVAKLLVHLSKGNAVRREYQNHRELNFVLMLAHLRSMQPANIWELIVEFDRNMERVVQGDLRCKIKAYICVFLNVAKAQADWQSHHH